LDKQKQVIMFVGKQTDDGVSIDENLVDMGYETVCADFDTEHEEICAKCTEANADVMVINESASDGIDAFDLLKVAVRSCQCGIIYLSKNDDVLKEILALEIGADDYVKVPFHPGLLAVRIRNLLKRTHSKDVKKEDEIRYPGLVVNLSQYRAEIDGERIKMPPKELELLYLLAALHKARFPSCIKSSYCISISSLQPMYLLIIYGTKFRCFSTKFFCSAVNPITYTSYAHSLLSKTLLHSSIKQLHM